MLKDVLFDGKSLRTELGLTLTGSEIGVPAIKEKSISIDGSDGTVDLSDVFGRVFYENRKLSFTYKIGDRSRPFSQVFSDVQHMLHGKKVDIIISDDEYWKYNGRVTVNKWKSTKGIGEIVIDVDASPYKVLLFQQSKEWSSAGTYSIINEGAKVVGTMVVTGTATVNSHEYVAGTYDFDLDCGSNSIVIAGTGITVKISFNERRL